MAELMLYLADDFRSVETATRRVADVNSYIRHCDCELRDDVDVLYSRDGCSSRLLRLRLLLLRLPVPAPGVNNTLWESTLNVYFAYG